MLTFLSLSAREIARGDVLPEDAGENSRWLFLVYCDRKTGKRSVLRPLHYNNFITTFFVFSALKLKFSSVSLHVGKLFD